MRIEDRIDTPSKELDNGLDFFSCFPLSIDELCSPITSLHCCRTHEEAPGEAVSSVARLIGTGRTDFSEPHLQRESFRNVAPLQR